MLFLDFIIFNLRGFVLKRIIDFELVPIASTVVHVGKKKDYNDLMKIYELSGWSGSGMVLPTVWNAWHTFRERTCIIAGFRNTEKNPGEIGVIDLSYFGGVEVMKIWDFCKLQGISYEKFQEILRNWK